MVSECRQATFASRRSRERSGRCQNDRLAVFRELDDPRRGELQLTRQQAYRTDEVGDRTMA